jgi:arsenate reductase
MSTATIYHNPRCSKSRATLALLETQTSDIEIIKYLDNPPSEQQIKTIVKKLGGSLNSLLRKSEAEYQEQGFAAKNITEDEIIKLLHQHPKVMERPVVVYQNQAIIGRPPENVLRLFND